MQLQHGELHKLTIQFISNWLPITNEEAMLIGIEHLIDGLVLSQQILTGTAGTDSYQKDMSELMEVRKSFAHQKLAIASRRHSRFFASQIDACFNSTAGNYCQTLTSSWMLWIFL